MDTPENINALIEEYRVLLKNAVHPSSAHFDYEGDTVSHSHIAKLEKWMITSGDKLIFIPRMVMTTYLEKVFSKTRKLGWLIKCDKPMVHDEPLLLWEQEGVSIYKYSHFSGAASDSHIKSMSVIIKRLLAKYA